MTSLYHTLTLMSMTARILKDCGCKNGNEGMRRLTEVNPGGGLGFH